jgi:hypothetical protein
VSRIFDKFPHPAIQTKIVQHLVVFSSNKSAPANRQKDSIQTVIQISRRLDSFCMKWLRTLKCFQIFKTEIKNLKFTVIDVLFKVYPMVPLSCRSNGRTDL